MGREKEERGTIRRWEWRYWITIKIYGGRMRGKGTKRRQEQRYRITIEIYREIFPKCLVGFSRRFYFPLSSLFQRPAFLRQTVLLMILIQFYDIVPKTLKGLLAREMVPEPLDGLLWWEMISEPLDGLKRWYLDNYTAFWPERWYLSH